VCPLQRPAHSLIPNLRRRDLVIRECVGVNGRGYVNVGMTEPFAHRWKRNPKTEQLRTVRVTDRVQRDSFQSRLLRDAPRCLGHYIRPNVVAVGMAEHEIEIGAVIGAEHPACFVLLALQFPKEFDRRVREIQPADLSSLGLLDPEPALDLLEALADGQERSVQVDVGPRECQ
jgi:hypothetical protein